VTTIRPEFEPDPAGDSPALPPAKTSLTLAWLRLMRLPNVFTAIADVAMGYLFVHGSLAAPQKLACLIAASALLYTTGMVLNDVFDIEIDRKERPFRPLPAGRIPLGVARAFGFTLLVLGVGFGWLAGFAEPGGVAIPWRSGAIATALAACVLLYDGFLKATPLGPLGMGLCRFLNVLLGMSAAPQTFGPWPLEFSTPELLVAAGIGTYIVGVTLFARSEAAESKSPLLIAAIVVMICGAVMLGAFTEFAPPPQLQTQDMIVWMLLGLLMITVLRRASAAVLDPSPERVQAAVKHSILSLIWLDAAVALAVAPPVYAIAVAALLIPALLLGRWVYST
jgi:4-hydroxybenzoate polyprenyltransferase